MNYTIVISLLLLIIACKDIETQSSIASEGMKQELISDRNFLFPFELDTEQMVVDSLNEFEAGDCWGSIRSLSGDRYSVSIDTTICGEYGFNLNFYLMHNDRFQIAHQIEGDYSLIIGKCILKEDILDYREKPFKHLSRLDTADYTIDNVLMSKPFMTASVQDFQTTYEHIKMQVESAWSMTQQD